MKRRLLACLALLVAFVGAVAVRADRRGQLMQGAESTTELPMTLSGMVAWYRADDLTVSSNLASGTRVTAWSDRSGNGNHLTNLTGTAAKQPLIYSNIFFSRAAVQFTNAAGGPTHLQRTGPTGFSGETGATIIAVMNFGASSPAFGAVVITSNVVNEFRMNAGGGTMQPIWAGGGGDATTCPVGTTNNYYMGVFDDVLNQISAWSNTNGNALNPRTEAGAGFGSSLIRMGCRPAESIPFDGIVAELLIYNRPFNQTERNVIHTYMAQRYGAFPLP